MDKYNGEEILDATIKNGKVFDEFDVSSDVKEVEGYTLVESPEIMTGTFAEEEQEKVYYYARNTKVIVKYLEKDEEAQSLAEETIIEGYEGKEYTSEQKEIENYTFVESTNKTQGTMTREELEVVYYYLQNTKVTVNYIDKNTEEKLEVITKEGLVGDTYTAVAKDIEEYVLVERPEKETVEMAKEEIVLNYYYVHISSGVIEKHIDINTNEVLETQLYEGNEGDEYKTNTKEFEGYDIVEEKLPENAEGTMEVSIEEDGTINTRTKVTYYYAKESAGVKEEHIDIITGKPLEETVEYEGDEYTTKPKEIAGYVVVEEHYPENVTGAMKKEEIVVKYYYARAAKVEVEYIDQETKAKIIDNVVIEGYEGKEYKAEEKSFEGYKIFDKPYNSVGKMKITEDEEGELENTTKVRYYYKKVKEEDKPKEDIPTTITNIYNNGTKADTNGNSNNSQNGSASGNVGNSNNGNGISNNTGVSNYQKTPKSGDKIVVAVITIVILIVSNIVITYKKRKDKKNFIK